MLESLLVIFLMSALVSSVSASIFDADILEFIFYLSVAFLSFCLFLFPIFNL